MKRKSLKHRSKRAWIVAGVAAFAGVSLLSTGFAAWVVGVNQLTDEGSVSVEVDTTSSSSIVFTITSVTDAFVGETAEVTGKLVSVDGEEAKEDNMTFKLSFTVQQGSSATTKASSITFALSEAADGEADPNAANKVTVGANDYFGREEGTYTYLGAPEAVSLTDYIPSESTVDGGTLYTYSNVVVTLKWGTYFGNSAPSNFYNSMFTDSDPTIDDANQAEAELEALGNLSSISLDATLVLA